VGALPVKDLADAAHDMRELTANLSPLVSAVNDVSNRMKCLVAGIVEESQREARASLLTTLSEMNSKMTVALQSGLKTLIDEQGTALTKLNMLATSVSIEVNRMGAGHSLLELAAELQTLTEQLALVPKWPTFLTKLTAGRGA